jgi:hypothetical protein
VEALTRSAKRVSPWLPWLGVAAALSVTWTAMHPDDIDLAPSEAAAGGGVLMLYVAVMWGRWRALLHGAIVALFGVVGWVGARLSTGWLPTLQDTIGAGGVALVPFLFYRRWRAPIDDRDDDETRMSGELARLGLVYLLLTPTALTLAITTISLLPRAWDAPALAIDVAFPVHAFHVGRWLERWPALRWPASVAYEWIFRIIPLVVALRLRLSKPQATDFLVVCIVVCLLGQLGYFLTPIVGPAFAFERDFPDTMPNLAHIPMKALPVPPFLRNGMPSLHTAWALVLLWNLRPFALPIRALGVAMLVFTIVATLGFGQHYVIDLVAAVPYAVLSQTIGTIVPANRRTLRLAIAATCALLTLAWVLAPRFAWGIAGRAPAVVVAAAIVTVVASLVCARRLARAGDPDPTTA